ncbi:hypothetical protein BH09PLA1_BH09PLA1_32630 [soil metagenome]
MFSHVINPFTPRAPSHDLAQKVTFAAIKNAMDVAKSNGIGVECLGVVLPEDEPIVQPPITPVPALKRTVMDFGTFSKKRLYPLYLDVLRAGTDHGRGTYLIYTNIDISPQPNFYVELKRLIDAQAGADPMHPFIITRRSLVTRPYSDVSELPEMYKDPGSAHPGYDCFVFPRAWPPRMRMAATCLGAWWFTEVLLANLDTLSNQRTLVYKDLHLTFHVGDDPQWLGMDEFEQHNAREAAKAAKELRESTGADPFGSWLDWLEVKLTGKRPKIRRALIEWRMYRQKKAISRRGGINAN